MAWLTAHSIGDAAGGLPNLAKELERDDRTVQDFRGVNRSGAGLRSVAVLGLVNRR
jgi:hypothetical protein